MKWRGAEKPIRPVCGGPGVALVKALLRESNTGGSGAGLVVMRIAAADEVFIGIFGQDRKVVCDARLMSKAEWDRVPDLGVRQDRCSVAGFHNSMSRGDGELAPQRSVTSPFWRLSSASNSYQASALQRAGESTTLRR